MRIAVKQTLAGMTALLLTAGMAIGQQRAVTVSDDAELRAALTSAKPGDTIHIAPGAYAGGLHIDGLRGTKERPIIITAADPKKPPVISGGSGLHLIDPAHLVVQHLIIEKSTGNGLNIDDGGDMDSSAHHVTLVRLTVRDIGPEGNLDGIKLSGLTDFALIECTIERWGSGGSGIDMVGCKDGMVMGCTLRHKSDTAASSGVQAKGGTHDVGILACTFIHAGRRGVNLGGSTGDQFFRPPLKPEANVEARRIGVFNCTFVGSEAPIAFVSSVECRVWGSTFYRPGKWVLRILQEKPTDRFVACGQGSFAGNLIVWRKGDLRAFANVGPNTRPKTFEFIGNWWYCEDAPDQSKPDLPAAPKHSIIGRDPGLKIVDGVPRLTEASAAWGEVGAGDWRAEEQADPPAAQH